MRLAWFSPLPPVRSGIATYSAELLPRLTAGADAFDIDAFPEETAHDFVWRNRRAPYDLIVYQLGNARCHDYMWAYLARYPGLVVLHDAKLHHARARHLLQQNRADEYANELLFDQPHLHRDAAEYAINGLQGSTIFYLWPMLRPIMLAARRIGVHSAIVGNQLRAAFPATAIDAIRMGVPALAPTPDARAVVRGEYQIPANAIVFAAFGKVTAEKRIAAIVNALATLAREGLPVFLLIVGDAGGYPSLDDELRGSGIIDRVRIAGHVDDAAIANHLEAADVCLCLRWPTAQESSASWLRCLAAERATVVTDLAHTVDVPTGAALRVDVMDEEAALLTALRTLATDAALRHRIAADGHAFWAANHTLDAMEADYRRVLRAARESPAPNARDLPAHFTDDYSGLARDITNRFGLEIDILR